MNTRETFLKTCSTIRSNLESMLPLLDEDKTSKSAQHTLTLLSTIVERVEARDDGTIPEDIQEIMVQTQKVTDMLYAEMVRARTE